jgi:hypothetical protein
MAKTRQAMSGLAAVKLSWTSRVKVAMPQRLGG